MRGVAGGVAGIPVDKRGAVWGKLAFSGTIAGRRTKRPRFVHSVFRPVIPSASTWSIRESSGFQQKLAPV